jgi:hypothetical protein
MRSRAISHGRGGALAAAVVLAVLAGSLVAHAAPEARILRIDPRASLEEGMPILTTIVELAQHKRMSEISAACGAENFGCLADALEKPEALYSPFAFPQDNAFLTVTVDGAEVPAKLVSVAKWAESKAVEGVGTAFLLLVDASASMGARLGDAKDIARAFINTMGAFDIVDVMFFNDRDIVADSKWLDKKQTALQFLDANAARPFPSQGRTRSLLNIIKKAATDGFKELGNVGTSVRVPLHQTMVVLSNGVSGTDPGSASPAALALKDYMTKGRFPEDNPALPKTPVPIVSIWFPTRALEEFFVNAREFMENLANPEIGGYYGIIPVGEGAGRAARVVQAVRQRFDQMFIVKWRVACVAPTVSQTIKLYFKDTSPAILPDASFSNVPVGIDPTAWPLDIDYDLTRATAKKKPVHPGGRVKIFGDFCWGSDAKRAQLYLIPKGQPIPDSLKGHSIDEAKKVQKQLIASDMVGKAVSSGDTYVEFELPDKKFVVGKGSKLEARMVVVDTRAYRTSAVTQDKILTLPARNAPFNWLLVGGLTFGGVVLVLLIVQIVRGGGGGRGRRGPAAPPPPVVAGGMPYPPGPAPPGGYPPR